MEIKGQLLYSHSIGKCFFGAAIRHSIHHKWTTIQLLKANIHMLLLRIQTQSEIVIPSSSAVGQNLPLAKNEARGLWC